MRPDRDRLAELAQEHAIGPRAGRIARAFVLDGPRDVDRRAFLRRFGLGFVKPLPVPVGPQIRSGYLKRGRTLAEHKDAAVVLYYGFSLLSAFNSLQASLAAFKSSGALPGGAEALEAFLDYRGFAARARRYADSS